MNMVVVIIAVWVGVSIGVGLAIGQLIKRHKQDEHILSMVRRGFITPNEAVEWRKTGKPPARMTRGALSPYDDKD
jgi:hypothetical protein